jgi:hypothetical protein
MLDMLLAYQPSWENPNFCEALAQRCWAGPWSACFAFLATCTVPWIRREERRAVPEADLVTALRQDRIEMWSLEHRKMVGF